MTGHRRTVFVEDAPVIAHRDYPGNQYVIRLNSRKCAAHAEPGNFLHIRCDPKLPMRRPFSIMRASNEEGWVEVLYKVVGEGTRLLSQRRPGESVSLMGPIGNAFQVHPEHPRALLLGGGVGIPPIVFFAERMHRGTNHEPFVIMASEVPFPFKTCPSKILVSGIPDGVIAAMALMEDWTIPSRLASMQGYPGCYEGYITDLARCWLNSLSPSLRYETEVFACGPHAMLAAVACLARDFSVPCQVALEEYMACAIGGCAGCIVQVKTEHGSAMKRVCVDGPVFSATDVF